MQGNFEGSKNVLKEMIPHRVKYIISMLVAGFLAFLGANVFSYFYYNAATGITNPDRYTKFKRETRKNNFYGKEGYGITITDENGFYNDGKVSPEIAEVLCIGSSHTEAIHVDTGKNWVSQMNVLNSAYNAYNLGISGQFIASSLYRLPFIPYFFHECKIIICETPHLGTLEDWEKIILYLENNDAPIKNVDWKKNSLIGKIYFSFPYFELCLGQFNELKRGGGSPPSCDLQDYRKKVNCAMGLLRQRLGNMPLVIVYLPRIRLERDGHITITNDDERQTILKEACQANQILYVFDQLSSAFIENYEVHRILPYGFINSHVGQGHLNVEGHRIVAETLNKVLQEEGSAQ